MEEGKGFEPLHPFGLAGFQDQYLTTRPTFHYGGAYRIRTCERAYCPLPH